MTKGSPRPATIRKSTNFASPTKSSIGRSGFALKENVIIRPPKRKVRPTILPAVPIAPTIPEHDPLDCVALKHFREKAKKNHVDVSSGTGLRTRIQYSPEKPPPAVEPTKIEPTNSDPDLKLVVEPQHSVCPPTFNTPAFHPTPHSAYPPFAAPVFMPPFLPAHRPMDVMGIVPHILLMSSDDRAKLQNILIAINMPPFLPQAFSGPPALNPQAPNFPAQKCLHWKMDPKLTWASKRSVFSPKCFESLKMTHLSNYDDIVDYEDAPGERVGRALPEALGDKLLDRFMSKFPRTGYTPSQTTHPRARRCAFVAKDPATAARIQQDLEELILEKREKTALSKIKKEEQERRVKLVC
ncbi:hypothetical protein BJ878DRAFT_76561 [Calycina marina]|uniref:Uncharacterized protein n=1 Tax=Calycina marina TaxID=1763456 RepID=A0A9P7ZA67_9HELO|nr:hypothetical protein BJ878DRAFT_76561 [Calycina marina]